MSAESVLQAEWERLGEDCRASDDRAERAALADRRALLREALVEVAALRAAVPSGDAEVERYVDLTLRCPECGRRADACFDHGDDWKKR